MKNGPYELVLAPASYPGKLYRGKYVYEHHLVWWQSTGDLVPEGFVIHHKNEDKRDNNPSNLELKNLSIHIKEHKELPLVELTCPECLSSFKLKAHKIRCRIKSNKYGIYCSRECSGYATHKLK